MGTKNNPGDFDCYANALPDEPMFILLARDPNGPRLVRDWALRREDDIAKGERPDSDGRMVAEARELAQSMTDWRKANDGAWRKPGASLSVTATTFPVLYKSFEDISHDSGGSAGWEFYPVPVKWVPLLPMTEAALAGLSDEERSEFCVGDSDIATKIAARSPELAVAHAVLNAFFDNPDWPHPSQVAEAS